MLILLFVIVPFTLATGCLNGWTQSSASQKCLKIVTFLTSFDGASDFCRMYGGFLLGISNGFENSEITDIAYAIAPKQKLWIGLSNEYTDDYYWQDGLSATYWNWEPGYPVPKEKSCVSLNTIDGKWSNELECNEQTAAGYICELGSEIPTSLPSVTTTSTIAATKDTTAGGSTSVTIATSSTSSTETSTSIPVTSTANRICSNATTTTTTTVTTTSTVISTALPTTTTPTTTTPAPTSAPRKFNCSSDWVKNTETNSCYFVVKSPSTFSLAEKDCVSKGSHLVSLHTTQEDQFVYSLFQKFTYWIGLQRSNVSVGWVWTDGSVLDYKIWCDGQPDQYATQECGVEGLKGEFCWDGSSCSPYRPYVCKKAM